MKEEYNLSVINQLLNLPHDILINFLKTNETDKDGRKYRPVWLKGVLKKLSILGESQIARYEIKENGRQYAKDTAQCFPTHIRNLIVKSDYIDYDIVNCHWEIFRNLCQMNNLKIPYTDQYCAFRDKTLTDFNLNKQDMLTILNMDKPRIKKSNQFLCHIIPELTDAKSKLHKILYDNEEITNTKNPISSFINKYHFNRIENEMLMKVINRKEVENAVLMYDGFMSDKNITIEELRDITGYKWKIKERELVTIPDQSDTPDIFGDQIDYADLYYNHHGEDWIINKHETGTELFHYNIKTNLWIRVPSPYNELTAYIKNQLLPIVANADFLTNNISKDVKSITKKIVELINSHSAVKNIANQFIDLLLYKWQENVEFDNKPHLIHFKNLSYDFKLMNWHERERDDYAIITAPIMTKTPDPESLKLITKIINEIHPDPENRYTYLQILSTCMMGKVLEKVVFANGTGGNGKGLLHGCLMKTLLGDYYYTGDNNCLIQKQSGANQSLANMKGKRMVVLEEPDENIPLNFCIIKMMTGGNEINARALYEKCTKTILVLTLIIECNKKPKLNGDTGDSMIRRLLDILFPSKWKAKDAPDRYKGDGYKDADPNLKEKLTEIAPVMFHYLIKFMTDNNLNYDNIYNIKVSKSIHDRGMEYIESNNPLKELIEDVAEKVKIVVDKEKPPLLSVKDLYKFIKQGDFWRASTHKFKRQYGKNNFIKALRNDPQLSQYVEEINGCCHLKEWKIRDDLISDDDDSDDETEGGLNK